ncbi:MAG: VWA domain-containing protein [Acidobacteria bacterium]|nr:VWA domain-containing protein [Acidobacteriota bacterium]
MTVLVPVLAAGMLVLLGAQGPPAAPSATGQGVFRAATELVTLGVTVTDAADRQVTGLGPDDFVVLENGKPQSIKFFSAGEAPLDVVLLVDTSSSMADKLEPSRQAAKRFLATLRPSDRASIVEFNTQVRVLHGFTSDRDLLERAIDATHAGGGTALYTGLYVALDHFARLDRAGDGVRKSAIVVLSDGQDTASLLGEEEVTERARRAGVPLYFISLLSAQEEQALAVARTRRRSTPHDFVLNALARETGARAYFPGRLEELEGVYETVANELAQQYMLAYAPGDVAADGSFRRILVRVPGHPGARPRTRAGYYAPGEHARR